MQDDDPGPGNRAFWNRTSDEYQRLHGAELARAPLAWGVWRVPESELRVLGDLADRDVLELGCGGAQWSIALAARGARMVGIDLSERQLDHARRLAAEAGIALPLVHGSSERLPFCDARFDVVFCDHGALSFARPEPSVAEAARVLRTGGTFAFCMANPWLEVCWDRGRDAAGERLERDYFGLRRIEEADGAVSHQLPTGAWIALFRRHGLAVEALHELRPAPDAETSYAAFVSREWARRWPAEQLWVLSKRGRERGRV